MMRPERARARGDQSDAYHSSKRMQFVLLTLILCALSGRTEVGRIPPGWKPVAESYSPLRGTNRPQTALIFSAVPECSLF
jgi:hypothetical protein